MPIKTPIYGYSLTKSEYFDERAKFIYAIKKTKALLNKFYCPSEGHQNLIGVAKGGYLTNAERH